MFGKLSSVFAFFKNFDTIKGVLTQVYTAISKTVSVLSYIETQITDTKLGNLLSDYLPKIIDILVKIVNIFQKYGGIIGLILPAFAAKKLSADEVDNELKEAKDTLDSIADSLDKFLK